MEPTESNANLVINQPVVEDKPKMFNIKLIVIIVAILVCCISGIVAILFLTGVIKTGSETVSNEPFPTPELAKTVCDKYGGKYETIDNSSEDYSLMYSCEKDSDDDYDGMFSYRIAFFDEGEFNTFRKSMKTSIIDSSVTVLEDSDNYLKFYVAPSEERYLSSHLLGALYKNAIIELQVNNGLFGEDLLVELGFPNRSRKESYDVIDTSENTSLNDAKMDAKYRDVLASLSYYMNQYLANNRGQLPEISNGRLVGFDSYFEADDFIDEATGNEFSLVAFDSFADSEYGVDDSLLNNVKSDEVYVFYKATCENNDKITLTDNPRKVAFVHSSSNNDGYYCTGN